jgi:NOL1/NOP2/fmu family ribosome biogenesis protein
MQGDIPSGYYYVAGDGLYFLPCVPPDIDGLKVPKIGLNMGKLNHCKFKPSQQFAMAYGDMFARKITFAYDSEDVKRYLRGETITVSSDFGDGWHAVCVGVKGKTEKGYVLGTGVINGGMLKNMYPKGWRRLI